MQILQLNRFSKIIISTIVLVLLVLARNKAAAECDIPCGSTVPPCCEVNLSICLTGSANGDTYGGCAGFDVPSSWWYTNVAAANKLETEYLSCYSSCTNAYANCIIEGCPSSGGSTGFIPGNNNYNYQYAMVTKAIHINSVSNAFNWNYVTTAVQTIGDQVVAIDTNGTILPMNFTLGTFDGTNILPTASATGVHFYAAPTSAVAFYGSSNAFSQIPWMDLGAGILDSNTGFWNLQWTPTTNQSYLLDTVVFDPTLTNYFTNSSGEITNGSATVFSFIQTAPPFPVLLNPNKLPGGNVALSVIGPVMANFNLQVSSDLKVWNTAFSATNFFMGSVDIIDASPEATNHFYRVQGAINPTPTITIEPQSQTVAAGSTASFTVAAAGTPPLTYQWEMNASPLPGATSTNINIFDATSRSAGSYTVIVHNNFGSITSSVAVLSIGSN